MDLSLHSDAIVRIFGISVASLAILAVITYVAWNHYSDKQEKKKADFSLNISVVFGGLLLVISVIGGIIMIFHSHPT